MLKKSLPIVFMVVLALWLATFTVSAVDVNLSVNSGDGNDVWFISGEPSLIINGFDLTRLGVTVPATVRSISISVNSPVPGTPIEAVVYQDANGGSPSDATLVGRKTVDITTSGVFTATFDTPLNVTQPVIWVGFYLPVNFRFNADTSGSSLLTYWGWRPGGSFDLASLANATVLGPSNGSAPVLINMGGIARITALVSTNSTTVTTTGTITPTAIGTLIPGATQVAGSAVDATGFMTPYSGCETLLRDRGDLVITLREQFGLECRLATRNDIFRLQPAAEGYIQRGSIYNVTAFVNGRGASSTDSFVAPVTHCIIADPNDLNRGVIGLAWDLERTWRYQTTVRYGNLICAELLHPGYITYFIPES